MPPSSAICRRQLPSYEVVKTSEQRQKFGTSGWSDHTCLPLPHAVNTPGTDPGQMLLAYLMGKCVFSFARSDGKKETSGEGSDGQLSCRSREEGMWVFVRQ
ncbi:uncharacterized protein LOC123513804 [Portunus trituberculatus]|uniref:uncharacterized protein LOC123513804 n=1 Tax=Portunus trituberculatus TaxID=210409 RepID=UPI001E1CB362|nr:uncharacterized protein LOC123513804 [Portunus trituberculatus]